VPTWHVMWTACAGAARRAKSFAVPGTLADAASGYRLLARAHPPTERAGGHVIFRVLSSFEGTRTARLLCAAERG
jgi:hypothetical protein